MNEYELTPRIIEFKDWATYLFGFSVILVAIIRTIFANRFKEFSRLLISDKYLKIYKDSNSIMSWFNFILYIVQLISFSFFIQLILSYFKLTTKANWIVFIQIFTFLSFFLLSKILVEKIIANIFDFESLVEQFSFYKISYNTYLGILFIPINLFLYYTNYIDAFVIKIMLIILLSIFMLTHILSLRIHQKLLQSHFFYFILYICTFEIAPYYFIYYAIRKA